MSPGLGPILDLQHGLFDTWHHSLFSSLHGRLKRSRHRTLDPAQASLFVIPFDNWLYYVLSTTKCSPGKYNPTDYFQQVVRTVTQSQYYQRYNGADHLYIHSAGSGTGPSVSPSDHSGFCQQCFKTCYWHQPGSHQTWISVPFPSMFHYHDGLTYTPWDASRRLQRSVLVTYIESIKRGAGRQIRAEIAAVCAAAAPEDCKGVIYSKQQASAASSGLGSLSDNGNGSGSGYDNSSSSSSSPVLSYLDSVFCLAPPGDDPTRRGLIDSLVAGCIPVTFHPNTSSTRCLCT